MIHNNVLLVELYLKNFKFNTTVIKSVINKYTEPWRYYHNLNHINDLLSKFRYSIYWDRLTHLERQKLNLAIIFHDVIYTVGSKSNELDSAAFLKMCNQSGDAKCLNQQVFSNTFITEVYDIILSTSDHVPTSKLSQILIQLDLSGFEGDFQTVLETAKLVEAEFSNKYTWEEFQQGQISFLTAYKPKMFSNNAESNIDRLIEYFGSKTDFNLL